MRERGRGDLQPDRKKKILIRNNLLVLKKEHKRYIKTFVLNEFLYYKNGSRGNRLIKGDDVFLQRRMKHF